VTGCGSVPLVEALRDLSSTWDGLLERSPAASPFASSAWHSAWASVASPEEVEASRAVLLNGSGGVVEAILPVAVHEVTFRRTRVTALTWAIGDLASPDHLDVLALPEADLATVIPALTSLPWDMVILSNLAPDATNAIRLGEALRRGGCAVRLDPLWSCPYLDLPGSWDEYLASLSPNRRQTLRRKERKLSRDHVVSLTDYGTGRLEEGLRRLVTLHEQRWAGAGTFSDPRVTRLHRCFAEDAARRGRLWLATLDLDGVPAAAWYGFADRDTVYFYQSGRDPGREDQSVGAVLMGMMIRRAIERGYRRFDFLRGDEAYKLQWTATQRTTTELVVFRPSWRGRWLRGLDLAGRLRARLRARRTGGVAPSHPERD
jgi:CelD/BcsL family acetyltransferase involved in cellulose biosynthesis